MTYQKLKNCPWCGEPVHLVGNDMDWFYVSCDNEECPRAVIVAYKTVKKAIRGWNENEALRGIVINGNTKTALHRL